MLQANRKNEKYVNDLGNPRMLKRMLLIRSKRSNLSSKELALCTMLCCEVICQIFEGPYFNSGFIVLERRLLLFTMSLWEQVIFTSCHCISLPGYK